MKTHFLDVRHGCVSANSGAQADRARLGFLAGIPAAGEVREKARATRPSAQAGSALLIVLGFLSFMMISAVSFAVYMRIERQASSNYRHATTARHLLNVGLSRAIDEVDDELNTPFVKFPGWDGRVMASYAATGTTARVLSLEALSFIPGILVNEVRKHAADEATGPRWCTINMSANMTGDGQVDIGRYAYLCVNVSDMLDVNVCKAAIRDSVTNRVSIGHLFADDAKRSTFDSNLKDTDKHYEMLQDFYACMYQRADPTFGSPYHEYLELGSEGNSYPDKKFSSATQHILITDSIVKPEPTSATPINITDPSYQANLEMAVDKFATQLAAIPSLNTGTSAKNHFKCLLMDYLDEDNQPYWKSGVGVGALYRPSVEMVPMIYQIILPNAGNLAPKIINETTGAGAALRTLVKLRLADPALCNGKVTLAIQTLFPFKYWKERQQKDSAAFDFTLDARAFLVAVKESADLKTQDQGFKNLTAPLAFALPLNMVTTTPRPTTESTVITAVPVIFTVPNCDVDLYEKDSNGNVTSWKNGFNANDKVRIALVVFAGIKQGGSFVDMVPGYWMPSQVPNDLDAAITAQQGIVDRLFFQTSALTITDNMPAVPPCPFEWTSLEVPDPRFNHKASNWVWGNKTSADRKISDTLASGLVGQDGRDGDVYMFVSNQGKLFSPGELGFLVRPYPNPDNQAKNVALKVNASADQTEDYNAMFRTVRLYDSDPSTPRDKIYDYFTAQSPDGTLPGARVNPLSDLPQVLAAAVESTPVDYWYAAQTALPAAVKNTFNKTLTPADWSAFTNGWTQCLVKAKKGSPINTSPKVHLSDVYGDVNTFKWAAATDVNTIFAQTLSEPLNEIDRKMLYSFSLESFSDRQQLFLYFLRAETTVPSFGGSSDSNTKSLAGGRAVALVWRDPYPTENTLAPNDHQHRILFFKQMDN